MLLVGSVGEIGSFLLVRIYFAAWFVIDARGVDGRVEKTKNSSLAQSEAGFNR